MACACLGLYHGRSVAGTFGGEDSSVHLIDIPETPAAWLNPELAEKWAMIRRVRRVVTAALEVSVRKR